MPSSSFLERIRQKPEATRVRYLFASVEISFFVIALLWIFSLKASLGAIGEKSAPSEILNTVKKTAGDSPDSLKDLIKSGEALTEDRLQNSAAPLPTTGEPLQNLPETSLAPKEPNTVSPTSPERKEGELSQPSEKMEGPGEQKNVPTESPPPSEMTNEAP